MRLLDFIFDLLIPIKVLNINYLLDKKKIKGNTTKMKRYLKKT